MHIQTKGKQGGLVEDSENKEGHSYMVVYVFSLWSDLFLGGNITTTDKKSKKALH